MNKIAGILSIAAGMMALAPRWAVGDWERIGGPEGGEVTALAVLGDAVFAGTISGVYRSLNKGTNWEQINKGLLLKPYCVYMDYTYKNYGVTAFATNGRDLFAGTYGSGVFRSADNGASWTAANSGLTNKRIRSLAIHGRFIFAGTGNGIFRSFDSGVSWTKLILDTTPAAKAVAGFAVIGSTIFAGTLGDGVFRSNDTGNCWVKVINGLNDSWIYSLAVSGSALFAGTYWGVFRSTNNGETWNVCNFMYAYSFAVSGTALFMGTNQGVFRSLDNGESWTAVNTGIADKRVLSLAGTGGIVYAGTDTGGVFRSTDNGANWTAVNTGLHGHDIRVVVVSGKTFIANTTSGIVRSTTNGVTWKPVDTKPAQAANCLLANGTDIFAGTDSGISVTPDNGVTWSKADSGLYFPDSGFSVYQLSAIGTNLLAYRIKHGGSKFGFSAMFFSENNGRSWTIAKQCGAIASVRFTVCGDKVIAGFPGINYWTGKLYSSFAISPDSGKSWPWAGYLDSVSSTSIAAKAGFLFCGTTGKGIYTSADTGRHWAPANSGLPGSNPVWSVTSFAVGSSAIFAGMDSVGVFFSTDNGQLWKPFSSGLPPASSINSLTVFGDHLYAVVNGSDFWRRPLSESAVETPPAKSAGAVSFSAAATPAGMNSRLRVSFFLPRAERVSLRVYNASGREVATLADKTVSAGAHTIYWESRSIAPGCYIVKLQRTSGVAVRSVPVLR